MTCVWNGLINKLQLKMTPFELCNFIKNNNTTTNNVFVNEEKIKEQQLKENIERINNINNINNGYDMSTCDPLLILIAEIYQVNIIHHFNGCKIIYKNVNANKEIIVYSNSHHFW